MDLEQCPATLELNYDGYLCYTYHIDCAACGEGEDSMYCKGTEDEAAAEFREDGWHLVQRTKGVYGGERVGAWVCPTCWAGAAANEGGVSACRKW